MAALKLGIVGAGQTAALHAQGYLESSDAEIVAVCDESEDRAISRREHRLGSLLGEWTEASAFTGCKHDGFHG